MRYEKRDRWSMKKIDKSIQDKTDQKMKNGREIEGQIEKVNTQRMIIKIYKRKVVEKSWKTWRKREREIVLKESKQTELE